MTGKERANGPTSTLGADLDDLFWAAKQAWWYHVALATGPRPDAQEHAAKGNEIANEEHLRWLARGICSVCDLEAPWEHPEGYRCDPEI